MFVINKTSLFEIVMSQGSIYLITNKVTGDKYVDQTVQPLNKIWQQHIQDAKRMSSHSLHKAFRKYGIDKFNIKQIDECDESLLNERKQHWIQYHDTINTGYNEQELVIPEIKENIIEVKPERNTERYQPWGSLTEKNRGNGKHFGLTIQGTHIETGEIKIWETVRDAAEAVAGNRNRNSNIILSARNGYKCYGYRWKLLDDRNKHKSVFSIHKKAQVFGPRYNSIAEARRELGNGCSSTGLTKSLRNPGRYSWKGYYWYYATYTESPT